MNRRIFYFLAFSILMLASCKKEDSPKTETIYRLKSRTDVSSGVSAIYEYDTQRRIVKVKKSNNQSRSEYSYFNGSITQDDYNAAGTLDGSRVHLLNSEGLAIKTTFSGTYYNTRSFNNHQQLLKETEYTAAGQAMVTNNYYYTGNRLDSLVATTSANRVIQKSVYEYYTDVNNTTGYQHCGLELIYGRQYPLAIKRLKIYTYDYTTGILNGTLFYDYTYEKDTGGRIEKSTYSGSSNGAEVYSYY